MSEIETAVRNGVNTITVINNNHSGNQALNGMIRLYDGKPTEKSNEMWVQNDTNFAKVAEDLGALGIRVERPGDITEAFQLALKADRSVVIDVVSDINAVAPLAWEPAV
jgi:acetolactate synthase-1/2/3 large subunit